MMGSEGKAMRRFNVVSDLYGVSPGIGIGAGLAILSLDAGVFLAIAMVAGVVMKIHHIDPYYMLARWVARFNFVLAFWAFISVLIRVAKGPPPAPEPTSWTSEFGYAAPRSFGAALPGPVALEPIVIKPSLIKESLLLLGCLVFVLPCLAAVLSPKGAQGVIWLALVFFGGGGIFLMSRMWSLRSGLHLDEDGFSYSSGGAQRRYAWTDVSNIRAVEGGRRLATVQFSVANPTSLLSKYNETVFQASEVLLNIYRIRPSKLAHLMNQYRNNALQGGAVRSSQYPL